MRRKSRRQSIGFGYIGFGNNHTVFNQKANIAFSALKDKLNEESHFHHQLSFSHQKLSESDRKKIKDRIRNYHKKRFIKTMIVFILLAAPIGYFVFLAIQNVMSKLQ